MEIQKTLQLAKDLMAQHGITCPLILTNAVAKGGSVIRDWNGNAVEIRLSYKHIQLNTEAIVRNTILHEIAHVLVGPGHHHDRVWQLKALSIGCDGERCISDKAILPEGRYKGICNCQKPHFAHRKTVLNKRYKCKTCFKPFSFHDTKDTEIPKLFSPAVP